MDNIPTPPPIFITGIGTGVGKTLVAAILVQALGADYWKPVQAGFENGTDSEWIRSVINNSNMVIHPEKYIFTMAASPHIAARNEKRYIEMKALLAAFNGIRDRMPVNRPLIIEGAGGLMVPLSATTFVSDLVVQLNARLVIVSRNYLGSINHSLLTAQSCQSRGIRDAAWIFNDQYLDYEEEITGWTDLPKIASIPYCYEANAEWVMNQAERIAPALHQWLEGQSGGHHR